MGQIKVSICTDEIEGRELAKIWMSEPKQCKGVFKGERSITQCEVSETNQSNRDIHVGTNVEVVVQHGVSDFK